MPDWSLQMNACISKCHHQEESQPFSISAHDYDHRVIIEEHYIEAPNRKKWNASTNLPFNTPRDVSAFQKKYFFYF